MSQDWSIAYEDTNGNWIATTSFYRPQQDLETSLISSMQKIKLADGSDGRVHTETKYTTGQISLVFFSTTSNFRTQIEGYIQNGTKIKITTHTSEVYIGYFIEYKRMWFVGREDEYDINTTFDRIS